VPGIDDRMTSELRRLEPPADPAGAYERVVAKRERRRIIRHAQHGALAFVVVVGTVAGAFGLNHVFRAGTDAIVPGETVENGLIAYTVNRPDWIQIFVRDPDGTNPRAITDPPASETYDLDPAWSPDGSLIAFARSSAKGISVFVADADGRNQRALTDPSLSAQEPEWSPDGSMIAFSAGCEGIMVMRADGTAVRSVVPSDGNDCPGSPTWSADGTSLAFHDDGELFVVGVDGTDLRNLTNTFEAYEANPAWSPDGDRIAFVRAADGDGSSEIWTMSPTGTDLRLVAGGELSPLFSAVWSPDGQYLLIEHDEAVFRARPDGHDFQRLFAGFEPAWQPLPEGTTETTPTPTPVRSPDPKAGLDIGLGFPVCNVTSVQGRFGKAQTIGTAYVATKRGDVGPCPNASDADNVVAVDVTGDGQADVSYGPIGCEVTCFAFAAPDVDGDGTGELLVQDVAFSIAGLRLFKIDVTGIADPPQIVPVTMAPPGDPAAGYEPGKPLQLWLGGDAFQLDALRCESGPYGRVLVATSAFSKPHDSPDAVWYAHETTLRMQQDGTIEVVGTRDFEEPATSESPSFATRRGLCGAALPSFYGGD
jgi:Tol biopolymer transport system component